MTDSPHLGLTLLASSQAQKEVTINEALVALDAIIGSGAIDRDLNTPPGSPSNGDLYIIGAVPTGTWATNGSAYDLVYYYNGWKYITPSEGLTVWVKDEDKFYTWNGSAWSAEGSGSDTFDLERNSNDAVGPILTLKKSRGTRAEPISVADEDVVGEIDVEANDAGYYSVVARYRWFADGSFLSGAVPTRLEYYQHTSEHIVKIYEIANTGYTSYQFGVGIGGATADATNKLSVNSPAVLFNRGTDSINVKLNKEAAANTASFMFQTNYITKFEFGLLSDDNLTFKAGSTEALKINQTNATVTVQKAFSLGGAQSVTIASGVITVAGSNYKVDTQAAAASDDLDTINGGTEEGQLLILQAANDARTVVVKHGTGNIKLNGSADFSLDAYGDTVTLYWDGFNWLQIAASNNG